MPLADGATGSADPRHRLGVGTWNLQSVNAQALPYVIVQQGADKAELTRDSFTFSSTYRITQSGQATTASDTASEADAGRYALGGNAITVTFNSDGSTVTRAVSGNTITVTDDGVVGVYRRQ